MTLTEFCDAVRALPVTWYRNHDGHIRTDLNTPTANRTAGTCCPITAIYNYQHPDTPMTVGDYAKAAEALGLNSITASVIVCMADGGTPWMDDSILTSLGNIISQCLDSLFTEQRGD